MKTVLCEDELEFTFPDGLQVIKLDQPGIPKPEGMRFVDFVVLGENATILIEVKDPSASNATDDQRESFRHRVIDGADINQVLVPKARDSYTYLHLMNQVSGYVIYCLVVAYKFERDDLRIVEQKLRRRLQQECDKPWARPYIQSIAIVEPAKLSTVLPSFTCTRKPLDN